MNHSSEKSGPRFRQVLPALSLLTGVFFANFMGRTVFGPLLLPLAADLHLTLAQGSGIFLCLSCGFSVSVLCAGFVSARLRHKPTIVLSAASMGVALLGLAVSGSFPSLLGWTLLLGAGAGLYMPSSVATITEITPAAQWGQAFAVHELAPNLAFMLAPLVAEIFLHGPGYAALFAVLGLCCLGLAGVYALRGPVVARPGLPPALGNIRLVAGRAAFWLVVLLFMLCVGVEVGIYNLIPAFLVQDHGLNRETANTILSVTRLVSLAALPCTGKVIRRLGYRRTLGVFVTGAGLATLLSGFGPLWWTTVMLTVQPICVVCFFPVGFAVLATVCPPATSDLAVALTVMCSSVAGLGLIPAVLARIGETHGLGLSFILFGSVMAVASLAAVRWLRIPTDAQAR